MSEEYMKQLAETVKIQQSQMAEQQAQITNLLTAMQQMPGMREPVKVDVRPAVVSAADIRAEKVQKLALNMRKSNRFKVFKVHNDSDIKLFLKKFDEEVKSLKVMVGINDDLKKEEYIPIFRASLDFSVIERVEQVLKKNVKTWDTVTID